MKKIVSLVLFFSVLLNADCQEFVEFSSFQNTTQKSFGSSVNMCSSFAIVSNTPKNIDETNNSVRIFQKNDDNTWSEFCTITSTDVVGFGKTVEISENFAFISAFSDTTHGVVYVYKLNTSNHNFEFSSTITPTNSEFGDDFGFSLSYNQTTSQIAISAPQNNSRGCAYIYSFNADNNTWLEDAFFQEDVTNVNCNWGFDIKFKNNNLLVGAPDESYFDAYNGRAYFYALNNSTWELQKIIVPSEHQHSQKFGYSVDFDSTNILISAVGFNSFTGAVYIFDNEENSYDEIQIIGHPNSNTNDYFGNDIEISGNYLTVGCINEFITENNSRSGACYIYKNGGNWRKIDKLYPQYNHTNALFFGNSIAMQDSSLIIGMPGNTIKKVFFYDLPKPFITLHPVNQDSINSSSITNFYIEADRAECYIWQASRNNGVSFTDLNKNISFLNVTCDTLSIFTDNILNNYLFRCKVSNEYGVSISNSAKLTLLYNSQVAKLYPNPNSGSFTISMFQDYVGWTAIVYDIRKQILWKTELNNNETYVEIGKIEPGVYILALVNGKTKEYHKFIVF